MFGAPSTSYILENKYQTPQLSYTNITGPKTPKMVLETDRAPPPAPPHPKHTDATKGNPLRHFSRAHAHLVEQLETKTWYAGHESTSKIAQIVTCKRQKKWSIRGGRAGGVAEGAR